MRNGLKKAIGSFLVVAMTLSLLPACTDNGGGTNFGNEATGMLTVFTGASAAETVNTALAIFEEKYPQVTVNTTMAPDEYSLSENLSEKLVAANPPDLMFFSCDLHEDTEQWLYNDYFYDLNNFLDSDSRFYRGDYVEAVLDAGAYGNKQGLMPVSFYLPVFLTSRENLNGLGITFNNQSDYDGFVSHIEEFVRKYGLNGEQGVYLTTDMNPPSPTYLFPASGLQPIDWENKQTAIEYEPFNCFLTISSLFDYSQRSALENITTSGNEFGRTGQAIANQEILFHMDWAASDWYFAYATLLAEGQTPLLYSMPSVNRETTAVPTLYAGIPQNAENKENAYRLIQILLSDEVQNTIDSLFGRVVKDHIPVLQSAIDVKVAGCKEDLAQSGLQNLPASVWENYSNMLKTVDAARNYTYSFEFLWAFRAMPDLDPSNPKYLLNVEAYYETYLKDGRPWYDKMAEWFVSELDVFGDFLQKKYQAESTIYQEYLDEMMMQYEMYFK